MGSVRSIADRSLIEGVRTELIGAIISGNLPPGSFLSLGQIAEERGLRPAALAAWLTAARREDLFSIQGDRINIAPLSRTDFTRAFELTRTIEDCLIERCCRQASCAQLVKLEKKFDQIVAQGPASEEDLSISGFSEQVFGMTSTSVEQNILRELRQVEQRYINIGTKIVDESTISSSSTPRQNPTEWFIGTWREIIAHLQAADVKGVVKSMSTNNRQKMAEVALEATGHTDSVADFSRYLRRRETVPM